MKSIYMAVILVVLVGIMAACGSEDQEPQNEPAADSNQETTAQNPERTTSVAEYTTEETVVQSLPRTGGAGGRG